MDMFISYGHIGTQNTNFLWFQPDCVALIYENLTCLFKNIYGVMGLRREFHYGVTTADEGLRPISPLKLKLPPPPSGRRFQTSQKTLSSLVMFIWLTCDNSKAQPSAHGTSLLT